MGSLRNLWNLFFLSFSLLIYLQFYLNVLVVAIRRTKSVDRPKCYFSNWSFVLFILGNHGFPYWLLVLVGRHTICRHQIVDDIPFGCTFSPKQCSHHLPAMIYDYYYLMFIFVLYIRTSSSQALAATSISFLFPPFVVLHSTSQNKIHHFVQFWWFSYKISLN